MRKIEANLKKTNIKVNPKLELIALLSDNEYKFDRIIGHGEHWIILTNEDKTQYAIVDYGLKKVFGIRPGYFEIDGDEKYFIDLEHNIENLNGIYVLFADSDPIYEDDNGIKLSYYQDNHIAFTHKDFKVMWGYAQEELFVTDEIWDRLYELKDLLDFLDRTDIKSIEQEVNEYQELINSI